MFYYLTFTLRASSQFIAIHRSGIILLRQLLLKRTLLFYLTVLTPPRLPLQISALTEVLRQAGVTYGGIYFGYPVSYYLTHVLQYPWRHFAPKTRFFYFWQTQIHMVRISNSSTQMANDTARWQWVALERNLQAIIRGRGVDKSDVRLYPYRLFSS